MNQRTFFNLSAILFVVFAVILSSNFVIRSGYCKEHQDNRALDEKVRTFLVTHKGKWHDWNIPYADGKVLTDRFQIQGSWFKADLSGVS